MSGRGPYPGAAGTAEYCGYGSHFWIVALRPGDQARCRDCGHVKGQRHRKTEGKR